MPKKTNSVNVTKLIDAFTAAESAYGKFTAEVKLLYALCTTSAQFIARRKEVNAAIDARFGTTEKCKETAKKIKAKTNTVLNRLLPDGVSLGKRNGGRKAATPKASTKVTQKAAQAPAQAPAATGKNQPTPMPLHDVGTILAAIRLIGEESDKKSALAKLNRIESQVKSAMFALSTIK
jgi:hypothetical protein